MPRKPFAEYTVRDWLVTAVVLGSLAAFCAVVIYLEPALRLLR